MQKSFNINIFHTDNESYKNRFIKNVTDAYLATALSGKYYSREDLNNLEQPNTQPASKCQLSCVVFIPEQVLLSNINNPDSYFSKLLSRLKSEFSPNTFFFNPLVNLHFTLAAQNITYDNIDDICSQLNRVSGFDVEIKGLSLSEYINGRLFFEVSFPTQTSIKVHNELINLLASYESKHYITPHCGFINLLRNLTEKEKALFSSIISENADKVFFKFRVETIDIIEPDSSIVIKPNFLKSVSLV